MNSRISNTPPKAIILAAGIGSRLGSLTQDCPKCLLEVNGVKILERMITTSLACGISEFVFVLGFMHERIEEFVQTRFPKIDAAFVLNKTFRSTNTGYSLLLAEPHCRGRSFVKFDADVVFEEKIIVALLNDPHENCLCIDRNVTLGAEEVKVIVGSGNRIFEASKTVPTEAAAGESIGIEKIGAHAALSLFDELKSMMLDLSKHDEYYERAYENLCPMGVDFFAVDISGQKWGEIDTPEDYKAANLDFNIHSLV